ncbi:hypothetical protein [Streptomyces sp. CS-7]|uniref:ATP dependent DNA ligase n=1 Tax=Streptomyces sp. CS-7 TaxID=2906769 RepID=UPI0037D9E28B
MEPYRTHPPRRTPPDHSHRRRPLRPSPARDRARWVLPQLVGEVRYTSRTHAGRLRHPSWHRLRPDLAPDDVT